jgi:hypothetical protein
MMFTLISRAGGNNDGGALLPLAIVLLSLPHIALAKEKPATCPGGWGVCPGDRSGTCVPPDFPCPDGKKPILSKKHK